MVTGIEKPYVVGMDIGGTNTVFGIVDQRGNVLATDSIKTQAYTKIEDYVDAVCEKLIPLIESMGGVEKIKGMGVGAPNGNFYNGTIEFAPNLPWKGVIPLAALFEEKIGVPTALTNDANAAAIGEMTYGAARGMKDFIMITLGTGVGSGIVINGQLVYGHDGFAGELGHVVVRRENGRLCGCGRRGCLETYCSATGVARTAREFLVARPEPSLLRDIPAEDIVSKDVYDAAVKGDKLAQDIFEFTGRILGEALADFIAFSSPEAIVLFGGLAKSGDYIMKPIKKALDENILKIFEGKTKLLVSELKDADAAVLGASALGWEVKEA
ncbi:MAG: ROK family protein [Bacteroidaceae bacterium]|nr:ROK family protein [Bacteroidaceae bacterium]MBQ4056861.1 ROK family protein [Bacteroidaceae bacterium]MBR6621059.1 ROK family protein [Bacteroides sp.]